MASGDISIDQSFVRSSAGPSKGTTASNRPSNGPGSSEDIWSHILLSVRTARAVPTFPIIVLGEPQTGKSSLIRSLAEGSSQGYIEAGGEDDEQDEDDGEIGRVDATPLSDEGKGGKQRRPRSQRGRRDLGLAYGYCDVQDDEGDDVLARLSLYTLSSSSDALLPLLPLAFSRKEASNTTSTTTSNNLGHVKPHSRPQPSLENLQESLFIVVLDWTKPQHFLEQLRTWIAIIRETIKSATHPAGADDRQRRQNEVMLGEMKDAVETYIRSYTPPNAPFGSILTGVPADGTDEAPQSGQTGEANDANNIDPDASVPVIVPVSAPLGMVAGGKDLLPLDDGNLDENLGVNIVVVLTKCDNVAKLERDRDFKEEQFDYIQQVLRTICLKYGAALFSTAHSRQSSFDVLRQYLLHRLFAARTATEPSSTTRIAFNHAASTTERDVLLVPSGWDSWGKIVALREGFSPQLTAQGWEWDCSVEERRRARNVPKDKIDEVEREMQQEQQESEGSNRGSACRLWEDVVGDWNTKASNHLHTTKVAPPDSQAFLAQHYATLQKETGSGAGAADPRSKFSRTNSSQGSTNHDTTTALRSIVGPMQSSSLSGPGVERAMGLARKDDLGLDAAGSSSSDASRDTKSRRRESRDFPPNQRRTSSGLSRPQSPQVAQGAAGVSSNGLRDAAGGATSPGTPSAAATTKQSEVLQSFFQDLLRGKSSTGPSGGGGGGGGSGTGSGASSLRQSQNSRPT